MREEHFGAEIDWAGEGLDFADDELDGLSGESRPARPYKTEEEIARLEVDASLNELEKAMFILKNGSDVQKVYVLARLPFLLTHYPEEGQSKLLPAVLELYSVENKVILGGAHHLHPVLEMEAMPSTLMPRLVEVAKRWKNSRDAEISREWFEVLATSVRYVPHALVQGIMIPDALADAGITQPSAIRQRGCRLFGAIAQRLSSKELKSTILSKCMNMCQDIDFEIRAAIASQIPHLIQSAGVELAQADIMPEFSELLTDEEIVVREAAILASMRIVHSEELELKSKIMIPLWRLCCEENQPKVRALLVREYGRFVHEVSNALTEEDREFFLSYFLAAARDGSEGEKELCAHNLPAVVQVLGVEPQGAIGDALAAVVEGLAASGNVKVRRSVAAGLVELMRMGDNFRLVRKLFLDLLGDASPEVSHALWPSVHAFVEYLAPRFPTPKEFEVVLKALLRAEAAGSNILTSEWRPHQVLLGQLADLHLYFEHDTLHDAVVPPLVAQLRSNTVLTVKREILGILSQYFKFLRKQDLRDKVYKHFAELRDSKHYAHRLLFLDLCALGINLFSHKHFRTKYLSGLTEMLNDRVPNIRLKALKLIPRLRYVLSGCTNIIFPQKMGNALWKLVSDERDREVLGEINAQLLEAGGWTISLSANRGKGTTADPAERLPYSMDELVNHFLQRTPNALQRGEVAAEQDAAEDKVREEWEAKQVADEQEADLASGTPNSKRGGAGAGHPGGTGAKGKDAPLLRMKDRGKGGPGVGGGSIAASSSRLDISGGYSVTSLRDSKRSIVARSTEFAASKRLSSPGSSRSDLATLSSGVRGRGGKGEGEGVRELGGSQSALSLRKDPHKSGSDPSLDRIASTQSIPPPARKAPGLGGGRK